MPSLSAATVQHKQVEGDTGFVGATSESQNTKVAPDTAKVKHA